jgi:hypothetical protein
VKSQAIVIEGGGGRVQKSDLVADLDPDRGVLDLPGRQVGLGEQGLERDPVGPQPFASEPRERPGRGRQAAKLDRAVFHMTLPAAARGRHRPEPLVATKDKSLAENSKRTGRSRSYLACRKTAPVFFKCIGCLHVGTRDFGCADR